jgi:hypothetical protein
MAAFTLTVSIGFGVYAVTKLTSHPVDETIKAPKVSPENFFKKSNNEANETSASSIEKKSAIEPTKDEVVLAAEKSAKTVVKNLNDCTSQIIGTKTDYYQVDGVEKVFKNSFSNQIIEVADEKKAIEFFDAIAKDSAEMVKNSQKFKESKQEPSTYVDWYFNDYLDQLKSEKSRIDEEKRAKEIAKMESMSYVYLAAVAFVIFVSFTIILVLFRIELNTRKNEN